MKKETKALAPDQRQYRRRVLHSGLYAGALTAAVLAVLVLLNLVAAALPAQFTEFDLTNSGMFTLSEQTKDLLTSLDRDVTAYYFGAAGAEDANITRLLDRYAGQSAHFRWEQRDPNLYPTLPQQYDVKTMDSVVLLCGDKSEVVDGGDMYTQDWDTYYATGSMTEEFTAENALTGGLARVLNEETLMLYQLTGHGELALGDTFVDTLKNQGVTVSDLNLTASGSIPADAAAVLLDAPQVDFDTADIETLRGYLAGGGRLLVATNVTTETPNLDALLAEYGLTREPGLVVEQDPAAYYYGASPLYLLASPVSSDVTAGMGQGLYVLAPMAQGIVHDADGGYTYSSLLTTSSTAYSMRDYATAQTLEQGPDDPSGPFTLAVAAEDSSTGARLVWFNCGNIFVEELNALVSGGNARLLGSVANWLLDTQSIVVEAKSMSAAAIQVPNLAIFLLGFLFVLALPVGCLIAGGVVCVLRRRR